MSYTLFDAHLDNEHGGGVCEKCADNEAKKAARAERARWLAAIRGNWTCLGCGAEIGAGLRLMYSEGCPRCAPVVSLINGA